LFGASQKAALVEENIDTKWNIYTVFPAS
jgi:hypothetical protein